MIYIGRSYTRECVGLRGSYHKWHWWHAGGFLEDVIENTRQTAGTFYIVMRWQGTTSPTSFLLPAIRHFVNVLKKEEKFDRNSILRIHDIDWR